MMQAFSTFSWMPDFMQSQHHDKMACTKPRANPVVNIPIFNTLKRKRTDSWCSVSPAEDVHTKCAKLDISSYASIGHESAAEKLSQDLALKIEDIAQVPVAPSQPEEVVFASTKTSDIDQSMLEEQKPIICMKPTSTMRARAHDKVEAQLNLEILLKHNELRLIEQELAKCQIALEQLRRCHIIPYPGQDESFVDAEQISSGNGPALEPSPGLVRPEHPTPWGVADGPYTSHYSRWLIPDAAFDAQPPQPTRQQASRKSVSGRSLRRGEADKGPVVSARAPRGVVPSPLYSLPSNYPLPKDRNSPLVATRPSDGKLVKLVCKFCGKDNVSSMQGFLNHCRIQHKHEYTSHGAAAEDCGIVLQDGELPTVSAPSHELPTPVSATAPALNKPLVHPLILHPPAEHCNDTIFTPAHGDLTEPSARALSVPVRIPVPGSKSSSGVTVSSLHLDQGSFVPSLLTPRLSSLLQKRGAKGDLQSLVENVKDHSDFDNICEQLASDDEEESKLATEVRTTETKPTRPRQQPKPKSRRASVYLQPRANPVAPDDTRLQFPSHSIPDEDAIMPDSLGASAMTTAPAMSSTVDFANLGSDSRVLKLEPSPRSFVFPRASTPTGSEHSPTSMDDLQLSPESSHHANNNGHDDASPHTIDTNPGLMSDNDDEDEEDRLTFATSSFHGDDVASDAVDRRCGHDAMHIDVRVRGSEIDEEHHDRHEREHTHRVDATVVGRNGGVKTSEQPMGLQVQNREGFVGIGRGGRRGGRGRSRGSMSAGTGRGKGGARRMTATATQDA